MVKYSAWTLFLLQSVLTVKVLSQGDFNLEDALGGDVLPTVHGRTTKAPPNIQSSKPRDNDFDLADALQPNIDKPGKPNKKDQGGGLSDDDLFGVAKDENYKPDKGKGNQPGHGDGRTDQNGQSATTAEVGTIGGIVSAVAMALVGAITSYISYQKKKLCFGIQQSLNVDVVKSENQDAVVAVEPQVQQTLLEPPNAGRPLNEDNPV